ncbi:hypothetical protein HMPREF2656_01370 [Corynebacterium sp. HMSC034B08]|nr:hypothetical protein HMPREF2656_01370 [Corynebacterium sp. HMSC034B08]
MTVQELQQFRVVVGNAFNRGCLARLHAGQRDGFGGVDTPAGRGDGVTVGVAGGVVKKCVDALDHEVAHGVLEIFRLVVHLVPGVAEGFHQKRFNETVAADHRHRIRVAEFGQFDRAVRLVCDKPLLAKFAHPVRHRGFPQPKVLCH